VNDADAYETGFQEVLERYNSALKRLVWSYVRSATDADDLFQEIAMAIWKALPRFRGDSSERTYIYRVAHNTAIRFVTSRQRKTEREEPADDAQTKTAGGFSPEQETIHNQRRERLWAAVQELPLIDRQIILLYLEGLSLAEIEAVTGFTSGKTAMRLTRIRRRLADQLSEVRTGGGR
jgi:RNA polymerase sigma-70 factor (ECF subfamily)